MSTSFLPPTLPLLPLPPPQVLYPFLHVSLTLPAGHIATLLHSIAENVKERKGEEGSRMVAVVPVYEIDRRVGRWACGMFQPDHRI